jgi:hypothetical protein
LRSVIAGGTLLLAVLLVSRRSLEPVIFGRYSLEYFTLLVFFVPVLVTALGVALRGGRVLAGIGEVASDWRLYVTLALLSIPLVLVAIRFLSVGSPSDRVRILALVFVASSIMLGATWIAGWKGRAALNRFALGTMIAVGAVYAVVLLFSPVLGRWVEQNLGKSGITSFDVVSAPEVRDIRSLYHEPGAEFLYPGQVGRVREFTVHVRNNGWGFHDRERRFENPEGRTRFVLLGDAYVQGLEVPREEGLAAVLERRLNARADRYEVIPLARRDIGQTEELGLLRDYGVRLAPQLVILVWAPNDLLDNDPALREHKISGPQALLFSGLAIDRLISDWLFKRAYLLNERLRLGALRPDYWVLLAPQPEPVAAALARTEALLDEIVSACRQHGMELLLTARLPNNVLRWLRRFPGLRAYRFNPDAHHVFLEAYARSRGIHYLHMAPAMQEYYDVHPTGDPEQATWPIDGYWRAQGHRLTAELIEAYLSKNGLLEFGPD